MEAFRSDLMTSPQLTSTPADVTAMVQSVARGDRAMQRRLIETVLIPLLHARVGRVLLRRSAGCRNLREETKDLVQEALVHLFSTGAIARWDAARGPFGAYVGRIAENCVVSLLRKRGRNPWVNVPTSDEDLEARLEAMQGPHESGVASRADLQRLAEGLDADEWEMFFLFFVEDWSAEEVSALTGKSVDATRKQRQRLRGRARSLLEGSAAERPREEAQ
jgi:RNA polymerase sigma factor (sigma-70 family)